MEIFFLENNEWKKQGNGVIEIILDEDSKMGKFTLLQDNSNVPYVYDLNPNTAVKCVKFNKEAAAAAAAAAFVWSLKNLQSSKSETNNKASPLDVIQKSYFKLNNDGEDEKFEMALNKVYKILNFKKENIIGKSKAVNIVKETTNKIASIKEKSENSSEKNNNSNLKTNFGGFIFNSPPIIQPPSLKLNASNEKPKEQTKNSPFAAFSFPTTTTTKVTTTTLSVTSTTTNTNTVPSLKSIMSESPSNKNTSSNNVNLFSSVKADPNSFKKNENFVGFAGKH